MAADGDDDRLAMAHRSLGRVRVKDVYRVANTITSRTITSVCIESAYSLPSSLGSSAKNKLVTRQTSARGDGDSLDTTHCDGETVTTPADFTTRLPDLHSVHSAHNHFTCTPWPVDQNMCWILHWAAALRHHRRP
jgi:hypothetical protein